MLDRIIENHEREVRRGFRQGLLIGLLALLVVSALLWFAGCSITIERARADALSFLNRQAPKGAEAQAEEIALLQALIREANGSDDLALAYLKHQGVPEDETHRRVALARATRGKP